MSLLFMMPRMGVVSELWLHRQLDGVADGVSALLCKHTQVDQWKGSKHSLPVTKLAPRPADLGTRLKVRLGLRPRDEAWWTPPRLVAAAAEHGGVHAVLVHFADFALEFAPVWAGLNKPVYVHCHGFDVTWDLASPENPGVPGHPAGYLERVRDMGKQVVMIANSQHTRRRLIEAGFAGERIVVKYLGVPVSDRPPARPARTGPTTFLFLGRLVDFKGPDLLIRAFEIACDRGLDGRLIVAGHGPLRATCELLRSRSRHRDRIEMPGEVPWDQTRALRDRADVFVAHNCRGPLTRQEEALGVAFIEAMAEGLAVVSAANGSLPEVVEHGVTGLLVEPGDVEAQAAELLDLAGNPDRRAAMGHAGWQRVRERFTLEQEIRQLRTMLKLEPGGRHE